MREFQRALKQLSLRMEPKRKLTHTRTKKARELERPKNIVEQFVIREDRSV